MALGKNLTPVVVVVGLTLAGSGSSATTAIPGCKLVSYTVRVNFGDTRHNNIDHAFDARRAGHPRTLRIARQEADANRKASLRGIPTQRGFDRDEYPPAMSDQGGEGASVRYIEFRENRAPEG
jgi:Deoxyribonuclease NucA/NucB